MSKKGHSKILSCISLASQLPTMHFTTHEVDRA